MTGTELRLVPGTDAPVTSVKIVVAGGFGSGKTIVAINGFDGEFPHGVADVRDALSIGSGIPIVQCHARSRESVRDALVTLATHAMAGQ